MNTELKQGVHDMLAYFKAIGLDYVPISRSSIEAAGQVKRVPAARPQASNAAPVQALCRKDKEAALVALREEIGDCSRCRLCSDRKNIVFGEGNPDAKIMFIGEAPGREEDLQARPFVGEAGQQLTRLIGKSGFEREDVYIANICKCRPPENRDPETGEIEACFPFLNRQISIIAPRVIISLGKISTYSLMKPEYPIAKFSILRTRGKWFDYEGLPVMPTTHPAYWLRNKEDKHKVWEDTQAVLKKLEEN
jgi:uracil-DNA glycosylase